ARSMGKTYVGCNTAILEVTDAGSAALYAGDPFMSDCVNAAHKADSHFSNISGLQGDANGNLFAFSCSAIRQIAPADGGVTTYAGTMGTSGYADGALNMALFSQFGGPLQFAGLFSLYLGEAGVIRMLDSSFNQVYTAAGLPPSTHDPDKRG